MGPEIARLGVQDATAEQRQQIIDACSAAMPGSDPPGGEADDVLRRIEQVTAAFDTLSAATDNDYLRGIHERLHDGLSRVWTLILTEAGGSMPDPPIDAGWLEIIKRRDGDAAAARVRDHIADSHSRVLRILSRWPSVVASEITPLHG